MNHSKYCPSLATNFAHLSGRARIPQFYPSIKDFKGSSEINPNISFSGNRLIDYFNYFCDSSLLQKIVEETNRYATQNPITQCSHMKA